MMKVEYIGLLRHDGTEPPRESGYRRIPVKTPARQVVFPEVTAPGYGVIAQLAVYADETAMEPLDVLTFPVALDVHEGVVPVIQNGVLYRGVEVQATVELCSADLCRTGG